jgi:RNA polymerase sigma-70 factor (ECF subfamily)
VIVTAQYNVPDPRTVPDSPEPESLEPEGLEGICEEYRTELRRFFELRAWRRDAVDDLVQLVYIRLLCKRPTSLIRNPKQFMYKVAWNVLRSENQRLQREQRRTVSCSANELEDLAEQVSALWVHDDSGEELAQDQVERVLRQLPRACQCALLLQYRDGYTYKQIAEELGVTTHAVKKYIVRGLAAFRLSFNSSDTDR